MKQIVSISAILAAIVLLGGCSALVAFLTGSNKKPPAKQ
jgi:PBP1b-binding outer membrane lipoprotein LpoB